VSVTGVSHMEELPDRLPRDAARHEAGRIHLDRL
jgi:hypothetical protein